MNKSFWNGTIGSYRVYRDKTPGQWIAHINMLEKELHYLKIEINERQRAEKSNKNAAQV